MNYYLFVTGCQQNIYDSEKITHLLEKMGYFESLEKEADIIIAVACAVRQKAVDRIFGKLKIWNKLPKKPKIIIVGCVLPYDRKKLANKVDSILDSKEIITKLPKLLNNKKLKIKNCPSCHEADKLKIRNINIIYIPIMYGCNNFCSYCAVPYTRGREVSRSEKDILSEIKSSTKNSSGKIMLLGQNVNSYQQSVISCQKKLNTENCNLKTGSDFVDLLNKIEKIESVKEITFMTSHPKDVSEKLINWMASSKKFSRELHLPLQSGDDNILKKMNRHYTANQYLNLINSIRKKVNISFLSTDIIVGFPGETENQFKNTFNICMEIVFDKAYISQYSPRPGTIAVKMEDDIPLAKKKRRWKILDNLINKKG